LEWHDLCFVYSRNDEAELQAMLRTMISDTPFEQRWVLQGRLCKQWAADLKERWESTRSAREGRKCTIDLEDVISVDTVGEDVLKEMAAEGAALSATRAYMKHILKSLHVPPQPARRGE
jgi:ABC-type transporter Mla MlaB component